MHIICLIRSNNYDTVAGSHVWNEFPDFPMGILSRFALESVPSFTSVYLFSICSRITLESIPGFPSVVFFLDLLQDAKESVSRFPSVFILDQLQDNLRWNRFRDFSPLSPFWI
jgi:hypothetical protein